MRSKPHLVALFMIATSVGIGQAAEQEQFHADDLERHFDPKELALRFNKPARNLGRLPGCVIAVLHLEGYGMLLTLSEEDCGITLPKLQPYI